MKRILPLVVLSLCALIASASPKSQTMALDETFEAGARSGNVEQMVSIYAADAMLMPPNMPSLTGREAIGKFWSGMLQGGTVAIDLIMDDFWSAGDLAVARGHYEVTSPVTDSGKYVLVLRKRAGKWLVVTDIWNASQAAPQ